MSYRPPAYHRGHRLRAEDASGSDSATRQKEGVDVPPNDHPLLVIALTVVILAVLGFAGYVVTVLHANSPLMIAGVISASATLVGAAAGLVRAMRGR